MNTLKHFITITKHRNKVCALCFKAGIPLRGLLHDLSKYSPSEFAVGARYYQGTRSPNAREREVCGYSLAWMHHKGRNRHHYEYWCDINYITKKYEPVEMPLRFFTEMICDRIAASIIYKGKDYTDRCPYEYYMREKNKAEMHPRTSEQLEFFLKMLADKGEAYTLNELKKLNRAKQK